ncbi:hypothetical protein [Pseudomonas fragi]|uniref:hypothetical protein n=1 Tax=Pseudomonas fragi TaxID=296 RepID=UPI00114036F1|nr:hypothetical protein [Pseudomonas fragi]
MATQTLLPLCTLLLLAGCTAQSAALPISQKLPPDRVAEIAMTIEQKYPKRSTEARDKLLSTVMQSLDNRVFVEGGEFEKGDFGWPFDDVPASQCDWPCGVDLGGCCPHVLGSSWNPGKHRNKKADLVDVVRVSKYI